MWKLLSTEFALRRLNTIIAIKMLQLSAAAINSYSILHYLLLFTFAKNTSINSVAGMDSGAASLLQTLKLNLSLIGPRIPALTSNSSLITTIPKIGSIQSTNAGAMWPWPCSWRPRLSWQIFCAGQVPFRTKGTLLGCGKMAICDIARW